MNARFFPALAALILASNAAQAQSTIDFEDIRPGSCASFGPSVTSRGFTFSGVGDGVYSCSADLIGGNSSQALINANSRSILTMFAQDGSSFSLNSFFAGARTGWYYGQTTSIDLVGNLTGGGTVSSSLSLDASSPSDFAQFVVGSEFTGLSSVVFTAQGTGSGPEFLIDDIAVNSAAAVVATPEPATLSLMFLGLGGLAVVRKRRRA